MEMKQNIAIETASLSSGIPKNPHFRTTRFVRIRQTPSYRESLAGDHDQQFFDKKQECSSGNARFGNYFCMGWVLGQLSVCMAKNRGQENYPCYSWVFAKNGSDITWV
jgi:hypothetical protein